MRIFINILLIMIGIGFIISGYKLKKYRDLSIVPNKWISIEKIKDKDGYIKFHSKWCYLGGIFSILIGITSTVNKYITQIDTIICVLDLVYMIGIFIFMYQSLGSISKFQK